MDYSIIMITLHINKEKLKKESLDSILNNKSDRICVNPDKQQQFEEEAKQRVEKHFEQIFVKDESIGEVLNNPLMTCYRQIFADMNFEELIKGSDKKKHHLNNLLILLGFGYSSIPHELIHAGTNKLLGGQNLEVVINKFYDLGLSNYLIPGVESKFLFPIIGGYVRPDPAQLSDASFMIMGAAPYILTPLGIYLLQKGKENKSLPLAIFGSGLILGHAGGMIGDFWNMGKIAFYNASELIHNFVGAQNFEESYNNLGFLGRSAGFYLGWKAMNFTYRLSKSVVNTLRGKNKQ
ncbi:hypothetical protein COV11_01355 [Candidatus Woesearchaeota archaeon CG10_big_fil_rev_8_21_14_0_10_30_7]|nr:MAG: hypothetical protein COV11_01355 [Candidatus Woesearchaeota archaeon CG10_big_fil_rev_8_21_14_0_10_30_7]